MNSLDTLKDTLRILIIESEGQFNISEKKDIIEASKKLGLNPSGLNNLILEITNNINWDSENRKAAKQKALNEKKDVNDDADETLKFILEQNSKQKMFEASVIKMFFKTSEELHKNERETALLLKSFLNEHNYIPQNALNGTSLRLSLESTNWFKDILPESSPSKSPTSTPILSSAVASTTSLTPLPTIKLSSTSESKQILSSTNTNGINEQGKSKFNYRILVLCTVLIIAAYCLYNVLNNKSIKNSQLSENHNDSSDYSNQSIKRVTQGYKKKNAKLESVSSQENDTSEKNINSDSSNIIESVQANDNATSGSGNGQDADAVVKDSEFNGGNYLTNATDKNRAYFYTLPDYSTKRKAHFDDQRSIYVQKIENGFGYVEYTNPQGQKSVGWIEMSYLIKQ